MVVEALERRRQADGRRWEIIEADAFEMPAIMGASSVDTVVYCSVLHEIFSYVPWPDANGTKRPYQHGSVRALLEASWRTLRPGGRIVIRDGVAPVSRPVVLALEADDARPSLELFAAEFAARRGPSPIGDWAIRWLGEPRREPFFLFLHFYDTHRDYSPLPRFERMFAREYGAWRRFGLHIAFPTIQRPSRRPEAIRYARRLRGRAVSRFSPSSFRSARPPLAIL